VSTRVHHHGLPVRRGDVLLVDDGSDSLLMRLGDEQTHLLNPTARAIWELCDGQTEPDEMVDAICQVFAVSRDDAIADVGRALEALTEVQLVDWVMFGEAGT
jgi:hypothetical protein